MDSEDSADASALLGPDELPPVLEQNADGASPFLFACDHYGRALPRALGDLGLLPAELDRHIAFDIGIAGVAEQLARARCASSRAALFAAGHRLQPAAERAELDS
jgi:predicted N-formylglutamate amidohydrolase